MVEYLLVTLVSLIPLRLIYINSFLFLLLSIYISCVLLVVVRMKTIILSSPHALCPVSDERKCDIVAGDAANCMQHSIALVNGLTSVYVQGNEYRHDHDLNRAPSRNTSYRRRLTQAMNIAGVKCILVDVHSFPNYWMKEAGDINFFKKNEAAPDVVILQGKHDIYNGVSISNTLCNNLKLKYNSKIITGITVNDILNEASEYNVPGVLIEFNEKYKTDHDGLNSLTIYIVSILNHILAKE